MITEEQLEKTIHAGLNENIEDMERRGFLVPEQNVKAYRQVRFGDYGIADIVMTGTFGGKPVIIIYELKADIVSSRDIDQISRYMSAATEVLINRGHYKTYSEGKSYVHGVLAAPRSNRPLIRIISDNLHFQSITFDALKGIEASTHDYDSIEDYLPGGESLDIPPALKVVS